MLNINIRNTSIKQLEELNTVAQIEQHFLEIFESIHVELALYTLEERFKLMQQLLRLHELVGQNEHFNPACDLLLQQAILSPVMKNHGEDIRSFKGDMPVFETSYSWGQIQTNDAKLVKDFSTHLKQQQKPYAYYFSSDNVFFLAWWIQTLQIKMIKPVNPAYPVTALRADLNYKRSDNDPLFPCIRKKLTYDEDALTRIIACTNLNVFKDLHEPSLSGKPLPVEAPSALTFFKRLQQYNLFTFNNLKRIIENWIATRGQHPEDRYYYWCEVNYSMKLLEELGYLSQPWFDRLKSPEQATVNWLLYQKKIDEQKLQEAYVEFLTLAPHTQTLITLFLQITGPLSFEDENYKKILAFFEDFSNDIAESELIVKALETVTTHKWLNESNYHLLLERGSQYAQKVLFEVSFSQLKERQFLSFIESTDIERKNELLDLLTHQTRRSRWNLNAVFFRDYDPKRTVLNQLKDDLERGTICTVQSIIDKWKQQTDTAVIHLHRNRFFSELRPNVKTETALFIEEIEREYGNLVLN